MRPSYRAHLLMAHFREASAAGIELFELMRHLDERTAETASRNSDSRY